MAKQGIHILQRQEALYGLNMRGYTPLRRMAENNVALFMIALGHSLDFTVFWALLWLESRH